MGCHVDIVRKNPTYSLYTRLKLNCSRSRSGEPDWSSVSSSPTAPSWSEKVSWQQGDILNPSTYTSHLENADAVIHSMGILLEADYKGVVSGKESPIAGLQRAFSAAKAGTQNPFDRKGDEPLRPQEKDGQLTYEVMNRDTGMLCAVWRLNDSLMDNCSHQSCAGIRKQKGAHLPLHIRRSWYSYSSRPVHNNKA
jgi:hypothetical protein